MARMIPPAEVLKAIAPNGLCDDCLRDRAPLSANLQAMMSHLKPPHFNRSTGECVGCNRLTEVTKHL